MPSLRGFGCRRMVAAHLIHGVYEPLGVRGKALCQLANALRHLSLLTVIRGRAQVIQQLLCDDLQVKWSQLSSRQPPLPRPSHLDSGAYICKSKPALGLKMHREHLIYI